MSKIDKLKEVLKAKGISISDEFLTNINFTDKNNEDRIKYLVIHYFGSLGTARAVAKYFNSPYRGASAHFSIDDGPIVYMCVKPEDIAWHCGAKKYVHSYCRNSNSIGIEVRPYKIDKSRATYASDKDWYFNQETINNLVILAQAIMDVYNIPKANVIRHYDVTGKYCPRPYMGDDINTYYKKSGNEMWKEFKSRLREPVNISNKVETSKDNSNTVNIKVGDTVKFTSNAVQWNGNKIPESYKAKEYKVKQIGTNGRTVLTINGVVMYAVDIKYLVSNKPADKPLEREVNYKVRVIEPPVEYRNGPGIQYKLNGTINTSGVYTIVKEYDGWGKLKSGAGWIYLENVNKL